MNKRQALAMLQFISELYMIMNTPEPEELEPELNGHKEADVLEEVKA